MFAVKAIISLAGYGGAAPAGAYPVYSAINLDGSADYFSRTPSASNTQVWTYSAWVKLDTIQAGTFIEAGTGAAGERFNFYYDTDYSCLAFYHTRTGTTSCASLGTTAFSTGTWYHVVCAVDTTQATAADRVKIYLDGVQETLSAYPSFQGQPDQNTNMYVNTANPHYISRTSHAAVGFMDGLITEVAFVDGQQLTPSSFATANEPIDVSGLTFGTNGFYLRGRDIANLGADSSGNGNNWTENSITSANANYFTPEIGYGLYSCDLDGAADSFSWTSGAGNRQKFTISMWVKFDSFSTSPALISCGTGAGDRFVLYYRLASTEFRILCDDAASETMIYGGSGAGLSINTWYHVVVAVDTTQATAANRLRLYVDGVEASQAGSTIPVQNKLLEFNNSRSHSIGQDNTGGLFFNGLMSDIVVIDGQQLTPANFATDNQPIDVSGLVFGTNGFYLPFVDGDGLGDDYSGNANNWTENSIAAANQRLRRPPQNVYNNYSVDLDGSADYFNRTPSAGTTTKFTFSAWVKQDAIGSWRWLMSAGTAVASDYAGIAIDGTNNKLYFYDRQSSSTKAHIIADTTPLTDTSAWYHVVVAVDSTQGSSADRCQIWINGTAQSITETQVIASSQTFLVNSAVNHNIGRRFDNSEYFNGLMTEIVFVDGQQLTPSSFASAGSPISVHELDFGTNGFYLPMWDADNLGDDYSGNGNDWTENSIAAANQSTTVPS